MKKLLAIAMTIGALALVWAPSAIADGMHNGTNNSNPGFVQNTSGDLQNVVIDGNGKALAKGDVNN